MEKAWIDFSKGAIPRYRKLLTDANQMSFQNTVLVHNDNDSWWLGYIQDMEGDHAFINFDSTIVAACWVHMRAVWPFPLYWDRDGHGTNPDCRNAPVFVALRDEDNGPFRFRPAVILELISCCKTFEGMFYITTDASYANTPLQKPRFEMVGDGQVVNLLPPTGPPLIKRCSGLLYNKHFVPFAKAQALLRDPSDKFRIISHLYTNDLRKRMGLPFPSDCRRFHLRIEQDGCMFIIISFANDPQTMQRTTAKLLEVLETHMTSRDKLPPIAYRIFRPNEGVACKADVELNAMTPSDSIRNLPPLLLENVFPHLDLHSQMRMKRVCMLWFLLLNSPSMAEHISISLESCWQLKVDSGNCFKAADLLIRSITSETISLTLLEFPPPDHSLFLIKLLEAKKIRLPLIVFKDHFYNDNLPSFDYHQKQYRLKHTAMIHLTLYKHACNSILLHNYTVSALFGPLMYEIFENPFYHPKPFLGGCRPPPHEQKLMKRLTWDFPKLAIDKMQINIPRLLLQCSAGKMHMASRFMCALNDNFPPVTANMLAKVTAVHERWVQTVRYPDHWQNIRNYLSMFSGFQPDGKPKAWNDVDLRLLDVSKLSKMALYGIDELFLV